MKAQAAFSLLQKLESGEEHVQTTSLVIAEVVFTLQHHYREPRQRVRDLVLPIVRLRGLQLAGKAVIERAFELYLRYNVSFTNAHSAAFMERANRVEIYTWDEDFDRITGLRRLEP